MRSGDSLGSLLGIWVKVIVLLHHWKVLCSLFSWRACQLHQVDGAQAIRTAADSMVLKLVGGVWTVEKLQRDLQTIWFSHRKGFITIEASVGVKVCGHLKI